MFPWIYLVRFCSSINLFFSLIEVTNIYKKNKQKKTNKHRYEHISNDNDHHIPTGNVNGNMISNYLVKACENFWPGNVQYKLIEKQKVYIMYNHVLSPEILVSPDLKLSMEDGQWLSYRAYYNRTALNLKLI